MLDALGPVSPHEAGFLLGVVLLAGIVRGFSGFGTALVFVPLASIVIPPVIAIALVVMLDMVGPLVNLRRALAEGEPRAVGWLSLGMLFGLGPGFALLLHAPVETIRWAASLTALGAAIALGLGWRWRGGRGPGVQTGVGGVSGFLGGMTGLSGPPVVLFLLAAPIAAATVRANLILYFLVLDLALLALLAATGQLGLGLVALAGALVLPFMAANYLGALAFRWPLLSRYYRPAALGLIATGALVGLPIWGRI
jgi:uncharacterized membrane protein YfcA